MDVRRPIPASQVAAVLAAVALILWRIWAVPLETVWRDWVVLVSIYGAVALLVPEGRARTSVTVGAMAGLMLLYAWGHVPRLLAFLGVLA